MKYMLSDAWKKVKEGDRIVLMREAIDGNKEIEDYYIEITKLDEKGFPCTFISPFDPPSIRQATSDQWQIIPAKKEPVRAEEYIKKANTELGKWCEEDVYKAFKFSAQNERLIFEPLMELLNHHGSKNVVSFGEKHTSEIMEEVQRIMSTLSSPD